MKEEIMMQVIPIRMIMQVESPDDYISGVRRGVAEQIRQDSINRKKFWMDGLKGIIVMLLIFAFAVLALAGLAAAEPQPVDGGWHRSDEVPVETPADAPPETTEQAEPEELTLGAYVTVMIFIYAMLAIMIIGGLTIIFLPFIFPEHKGFKR